MNISTYRQFKDLNQKLLKKKCKVDARFYFFVHLYYCLVNDRKLLLKICTSSHLNGSDLWQKLGELFMYISLEPKERMQGAPEVSYYPRFRNIKLIPIVFDAEMRSLIISLAQKYYEPVDMDTFDDPYSKFIKEIVIG